jgi:hypothetical protein
MRDTMYRWISIFLLISGLQYIGVTVEHCSSWYSTVNAQQLGAFIAINMVVTRTITAIVTMTLLTILLLSCCLHCCYCCCYLMRSNIAFVTIFFTGMIFLKTPALLFLGSLKLSKQTWRSIGYKPILVAESTDQSFSKSTLEYVLNFFRNPHEPHNV